MPAPRKKPPPRRISRKPVKASGLRAAPPAPAKNTRAVTNGSRADGRNLPGFADTKAEVQRAVDDAEWLQNTDKLILEMFSTALTAYRFTGRQLAQMTPVANMKAWNAHKIQVRREKVLLDMAAELGFTAAARYKLGLTAAKIQRAKQGAVPVRNEDRARQVAALLQQAGALPPPIVADAEVATEETVPETETTTPDAPEVITFPRGGHA